MRSPAHFLSFVFGFCVCAVVAVAQQAADSGGESERGPDRLDAESTRLLREYTTDARFLTEWIDHIPESETVPSPRDFLGYVIGTPGELTHPDEILAYYRQLEATSERVKVYPLGQSHGGREMILAAIASPEILARIPDIQAANRRLADPRETSRSAARTISETTPVTYYITAGLHSPELGPPEMVMELAYRLAVSEQAHIREIRENVLTLITPVLEMDGRARTVEWNRRHLGAVTDLDDTPPRSPPYWGDYTFHDNNRDGLQVSQPLTRHFTNAFHEFLPTVSLDLHESVPLLYVSTGTGPYNETIDPITITEWQWMASYDVSQATRLGLPGVWSWGFYTGWYPGYLLWVTNNHNAVGRFYETFGNGVAATVDRDLKSASYSDKRVNSRQWYRALPPDKQLVWSMRNNTNYMQTGVLAALQLAARNGDTLLFNFWQKGANALAKGAGEKPYAFHIAAEQRDAGALRELLRLLDEHRIEVHRATSEIVVGETTVASGDFLVAMDQPYSNLAKTLFEAQSFPRSAEHSPYDDISWSLPYMLGLDVDAIDEDGILAAGADMERVHGVPELTDTLDRAEGLDSGPFLLEHRGQASLASLCWRLPDGAEVAALAEDWNGHAAGSLVIGGVSQGELAALTDELLLDVESLPAGASPPTIAVDLPRIGLYHTWTYTQDSGWARYTLERLGIPYTLIDKDDVKAGGLLDRFDVILVPNTGRAPLKSLIHGVDSKWSPLAYTRTADYPSHGVIDSTDDMTGGMGFGGLENLHRFVKGGGLLIPLAGAGVLAADSGIAPGVTSHAPNGTPGSHVTTKVLRGEHPATWGYPELTHVFHGNVTSYSVPEHLQGRVLMQYGTKTRAEAEADADRKADIPVEEAESADGSGETDEETPELCLSGLVREPDALERVPAILDVPVGKGRVLFFSWNPLHRYQNHHDFAYLTNALLFHDDFPGTPTEKDMLAREAP